MTATLFKMELLLLGVLGKGIGGRQILVKNNLEEKLVSPMNLYEINAGVNLPESDLTEYLDNLKNLKLLQSAKMQAQNLPYYWISDKGLKLLNNFDLRKDLIKLKDDKYFKKLLIEKAIYTIRDSFSPICAISETDFSLATSALDKDIIEEMVAYSASNTLIGVPFHVEMMQQIISTLLADKAVQQDIAKYRNAITLPSYCYKVKPAEKWSFVKL